MAVIISCPSCGGRMRLAKTPLPERISCPHCQTQFAPQRATGQKRKRRPSRKDGSEEAGVSCPACKRGLPAGAVFCVHCGYDFKRKSRLKSTFRKAPDKPKGAVKRTRIEPLMGTSTPKLAPVTWSEVLSTPLDAENVLAETAALTIWALFYTVFLLGYCLCIVLLGSFGILSMMAACGVIAGCLRFWLISKDVSIKWFLSFLGILFLISLAGAFLVNAFQDSDPEAADLRPLLTVGIFFLLVFVILVLRAISFFFGKYFAICRRSALGAMVSDSDQGGLVDLGYALVIGAISGLPALVIAVVALVLSGWEGIQEPVSAAVVVGLLALALLWWYVYFPIAAAAVALKRTLHPGTVLSWAWRCMPDYFYLLLLLAPFCQVAILLSWGLATVLTAETTVTIIPPALAAILWGGFSFFVLIQYTMAVTFTALGRILRRNQARIGWLRETLEIY